MLQPRHLMARLATAGLFALWLTGCANAEDDNVLLGSDFVCQHPPYEAHVVSSSPLVVYLAGFVTPAERSHLRAATQDLFAHSAVADGGQADGRTVHRVRQSQSTNVPHDAVVRCIEERALRFQGILVLPQQPDTADMAEEEETARLEPLQLVKYGAGEHYHYHTDWFTDPVHATAAMGGNRASSFFAYISVNGTADRGLRGGGTNFPLLHAPPLRAGTDGWCRFIDCDEPWDSGITFRPVEGNAVYWDNLLPGGAGDPRTLHAGLPVVSGEKMGMNIWTRQEKLPARFRDRYV